MNVYSLDDITTVVPSEKCPFHEASGGDRVPSEPRTPHRS